MTSIIKVDNLQNQCGANIISESANIITIGASGDTVTLAAGASQSGFGRSGSVNWDTTPKTATPVTAVSGNGYFVNTTSGAVTVNLPVGVAGSIVAISDYANTAATNNITITPNGTDNINGGNFNYKISTNGAAITLIYIDSTRGWKDVNDATLDATGASQFIIATGGTITTCGDYKIHSFTSPGTFTVTAAGTPAGSTTVDYLVVAGGGSGGSFYAGGGGGAGGYRESKSPTAPWTASPLASSTSLPVSATAYPVTVGGGGAVTPNIGSQGTPSIFSTITSTGGGYGGGRVCSPSNSNSGGSGGSGGGGAGYCGTYAGLGGSGNTPPVSPSQGSSGGNANVSAPGYGAGGGGGAGAVGTAGTSTTAGAGGNGVASSIRGSSVTRAGGGGGVGQGTAVAPGGTGGGGAGAGPGTYPTAGGVAGTTNTGGGGGGSLGPTGTGTGGSGIVVIRYKFQ
jgi:hypothetical protein